MLSNFRLHKVNIDLLVPWTSLAEGPKPYIITDFVLLEIHCKRAIGEPPSQPAPRQTKQKAQSITYDDLTQMVIFSLDCKQLPVNSLVFNVSSFVFLLLTF